MKKTRTKTKTKAEAVQMNKVLAHMMDWARECGKILNSHLIKSYEKPLRLVDKGGAGLATEADLLSEAYVIKQIKKHYPAHKILSEEDAFTRQLKIKGVKADEYLWLIDPLDGTNNFFNKLPFFAVSLALNKGKKTVAGIVYNPATCELFYAVRGKGAYLVRLLGNKEVAIKLKSDRKRKVFKEALLSANLTSKRVEEDFLKTFPEVRAMRRLGSAALEMSYVAAGMLDAYWEYTLQPWDMAAAGLICEEAGAKISSISGQEYHVFGTSVLVSHPALYSSLKDILNK